MTDNTTIFTFSPPKSDEKLDCLPVDLEEARAEKPTMVLDMGEASREQGFRLNGCR